VGARDCYNPNTIANPVLMFPGNFAQPAANAVSHNGRTNCSRSHKSGAESIEGSH
jgi:hypothetical protein